MSQRIEMPVNATAASWFSVMRVYSAVISTPGDVVLDASVMRRVEPFGATVLALAVAQREYGGLPRGSWIPPEDEECAAFLQEIAFPLYVTGSSEQRDSAKWHGTLEMRQVRTLDPVYLADIAQLLVERVPGTTEEASHLVQLCLNELVTNVRDHAHSPVGCFILSRWYQEQENVRIAIADAGDTIPGALRTQPRYADRSDEDLLYASVMVEGVTSRSMRRGGFGLKNVRDLTTQRDGGILLTSGQAKFEVRGTKEATVRLMRGVPAFRGTAIEIDFRPGLDVETSEEEVF